MRSATALGEKPAKTVLDTAPILAAARTAATASTVLGM